MLVSPPSERRRRLGTRADLAELERDGSSRSRRVRSSGSRTSRAARDQDHHSALKTLAYCAVGLCSNAFRQPRRASRRTFSHERSEPEVWSEDFDCLTPVNVGLDSAAIAWLTATGKCKRQDVEYHCKVCAICQEAFATGETFRMLPCTHIYHIGCIDRWLATSRDCPMCKADVLTTFRPFVFHGLSCGRRLRVAQAFKKAVSPETWRSANPLEIHPCVLSTKTVGVSVQRGPHWKWGNQDGRWGIGMTVPGCDQDGWIRVKWSTGDENNYRIGFEGYCDLRLCEDLS